MDITQLRLLIENNFWVQQIFIGSASLIIEVLLNKLHNRLSRKDLSWQLLHCLQKAHENTCEKLKWEYDENIYIGLSKELLSSNNVPYDENSLVNIFSTAVGQPINSFDLECWINNFEIELSKKEHEQLREFIKLKLLLNKNSISNIKKSYLERFQQIVFTNEYITLSLHNLYIPNQYSIFSEKRVRNDILDLIDAFISGDINHWINSRKIDCSRDVNVLFVFGNQCNGKSTLVSKIIYDCYFNAYNQKQIHVVNFSDRGFKNNDLSPQSICNYLNIKTECLMNSVLIIDGLDESEWSSATASNRLEHLINDLKEYQCKLIVTSRPNYFFTVDFRNTLDILLKPFSIEQAEEWLIGYKEYDSSYDVKLTMKQISRLSTDITKIILIPFVLYTCVTNKIQFDLITEVARLYDIVFSNDEAIFLTTPYNPKSRNIQSVLKKYQHTIIDISKYAFCSKDGLIPIEYIDQLQKENGLDSNKITTEFLLLRKDINNYAFMHNSIPCYFISKTLFYVFITCHTENNYYRLIEELEFFCKDGITIPSSMIDFIRYFIRTNSYTKTISTNSIIEIIKLFLSGKFNDKLVFNANLVTIQKYYYHYFVNILRFIFAFISESLGSFECFDFFNYLTIDEKKQLILYTQLGQNSLDCINICSFININLDGISLRGINMRGKVMRYTSIKNANFNDANLSGAYFIKSDYSLSHFEETNCKNIDFTNSTLFGCSFRNARLNGADFTNAILDQADLRGAELNKCIFNGTSVKGTKILAEQLRYLFDFDIDYLRKNQVEVYLDDCLIPDELLEDEFKKQRPVGHILRQKHN